MPDDGVADEAADVPVVAVKSNKSAVGEVIIETRNYHMIGMNFMIKHCTCVQYDNSWFNTG